MERQAEGPLISYRDLALYLGLAIPTVLLTAVAVHIGFSALPLTSVSKPVRLIVPQLAGYAAGIGILAGLVYAHGRSFSVAVRWKIPTGSAAIAIALGLVVSILTVVAAAVLRTPPIESPIQALMAEDPFTIALAAVTMAPICEELFFRGVLQPLLVRDAGVFGIVLADVPFALLHGAEYAWSWQHVLLVGTAGLSFGAIRHWTGSTGAAALTHATYNGMFLIFYVLGKSLV